MYVFCSESSKMWSVGGPKSILVAIQILFFLFCLLFIYELNRTENWVETKCCRLLLLLLLLSCGSGSCLLQRKRNIFNKRCCCFVCVLFCCGNIAFLSMLLFCRHLLLENSCLNLECKLGKLKSEWHGSARELFKNGNSSVP